jgi:hypothetical protein
MYFWNIKALKEELVNGQLSQRERFKYYLACTILYALSLELTVVSPVPFNNLLLVQSVLTIALTIAGTIYCYRINRAGDDQEFIDRIFCIGWVVGIKLAVFWIAAYLAYSIGGRLVGGDEFSSFAESFNVIDLAFSFVFCCVAYWLTGIHIGDVARGTSISRPI